MVENDYIMRLVHEIVRTLIRLIFKIDIDQDDNFGLEAEAQMYYHKLTSMIDDGKIDEAENLLTEKMDGKQTEDFQVALLFYESLNKKDDKFLEEHDFTRKEVSEGLMAAVNLYGYGSMIEAFRETIDK